MTAILDSLFHKIVSTTSSPLGMDGGGWWGAKQWLNLPIQKLLYGQMASIQATHITKCSYIDAQSNQPVL